MNIDLSHIAPHHLNELRNSGIHDDIIALNFCSIYDEDVYDFLTPDRKRRNDGRLTDSHLAAYNKKQSGWVCRGIDILTGGISSWGCFKPDEARTFVDDKGNQKKIKYEHVKNRPTEIFALRLTWRIGLKIAQKQGFEAEYLQRMGVSNPLFEDEGFWAWVIATPGLATAISEGSKKAAALISAGRLAIGLPGINGAYRSTNDDGLSCLPYLRSQTQIFCAEGRKMITCFDNDAKPKTRDAVGKATTRMNMLFRRGGCETSVVTITGSHKGIDDVLFNLGESEVDRLFANQQITRSWELDRLFALSGLPQTQVDMRYLDATILPSDIKGKLIAIKSAKGTGKTESIAKLISPYIDRGESALVITHRIQLAKALSAKFGINHLSEVRSSELGSQSGYALCIDSLHRDSQARFDPTSWEGSIVIIDEVEQVIQHALGGSTCARKRVEIISSLELLMITIAESGGSVIIADADLSAVSIDYFQKLTNNRMSLELIVNNHIPVQGKRSLTAFDKTPKMIAALVDAVRLGSRAMLCCSSQKVKSVWGTINVEAYLRGLFPDINILRVDAESVSDPNHEAYGCMADINKALASVDILIASPTIETGVSIDLNRFDSVWAIANGVQTVDAVCQTLERVRSDVPRYITISTGAISKIGNGATTPYRLVRSQNKMAASNISRLAATSESVGDAICEIAGLDYTPVDHLIVWAKYAAKANDGFAGYEEAILKKLELEGYAMIAHNPDLNKPRSAPDEIEEGIKAVKEINYTAEIEAKIEAKNPDDNQLSKLKKKRDKTRLERNQEAKGGLVRRYLSNDLDREIIEKDDDGWYPKIQLFYYLSVARNHLQPRDVVVAQGLNTNFKKIFAPDLNRAMLTDKVRALQAIEIEQFYREDKTFTNDSLAAWHKKILGYRDQIRDILKVSLHPESTPIQCAQQLLSVIGYRLTYIDRIRIDGVPTRRYAGVDCNFDLRMGVLGRWLDRDDLAAQELERSTDSYRSNLSQNSGSLAA